MATRPKEDYVRPLPIPWPPARRRRNLDAALDDARDRWPDGHVLSEIGEPLTFDQYTDYSPVTTPGLEVAGELYVRRCTLMLFEASHAQAGPLGLDWHVSPEGRATLSPHAGEGTP